MNERNQPTPTQSWETQTIRPQSVESTTQRMNGRESSSRQSYRDSRVDERYGSVARMHRRNDSEATGAASSGGYPETMQSGPPRRHDYDVQMMETTPTSPRAGTRNPIPAPIVTVRSEFPTISKSREQQSLTCLVTIEVPDKNWRPDPEDIGGAPAPSSQSAVAPSVTTPGRFEEAFNRERSPERPPPASRKFYPYESAEVLEEMTDNLRTRVENWHGLDFGR